MRNNSIYRISFYPPYICKTQFEDVKEALLEAKIEWLSYCNVKGIGKTCQGRI